MKGWVKITTSPTEQTTAITDIILAVMAIAVALYLPFISRHQPWKAGLWAGAFGLLAMAAMLGAVGHGLVFSENYKNLVWHGVFLSLGLLVALLITAVIYDVQGMAAARWALPMAFAVGLLFFGSTLIRPNTFFGFIIYQSAAMSLALLGYLWLAVTGQLAGAWLMAAGIFATLVAGAVQAGKRVSFTLIWPFNYNGVYHLLQMVGVGLIAAGLYAALAG